MGSLNQQIPAFLDRVIEFPDGQSFEITRPLTDLRKCHDGRPLEARIVFVCKQVNPEPSTTQHEAPEGDGEFVMKIKVQVPDNAGQEPIAGPSTTTTAELKALEIYTRSKTTYAPHLITFKTDVQKANGMFPGGYLTYMVMTKMPGQDLLALQFWNQRSDEWRQEIVDEFLHALRSIYALGIEPVDCALRNILWEEETKRCTIIDFELWREACEPFTDAKKELERWGLAKRKAPISWWAEWKLSGH